jgi:hypothetical protein
MKVSNGYIDLKQCHTCRRWLPTSTFMFDYSLECESCAKSKDQIPDEAEPEPEVLTKRQHQMVTIVDRDSISANALLNPDSTTRYCDYCQRLLPAEAFRVPYDTTCDECRRVKEHLRQVQKEDIRRLHQALTVKKTKQHAVVDSVEMKCCSSCAAWLPLNEFHKNKRSHDGLNNKCKTCALLNVQLSRLRKRARKLGIPCEL